MLIGIHDKETGKDYHICGGFPSASGKTNLAMMLAPDALGDRYHVSFYGDDIAWLWVDEEDGRLYGMNPEYGVFGVAKDTNEAHQPDRAGLGRRGHRDDLHQRRLQPDDRRGLVGGPHPEAAGRPRTAGSTGWARPIADRKDGRHGSVGPPQQPVHHDPGQRPQHRAPTTTPPPGVPIDAIIFGGRTRDREPLIRAITDLAEGVYDGLTLGAEATAAAEGKEGVLRYDPMSNRPFMAYGEGDYAAHYLDDRRGGDGPADLRARQLVPARPRGRPLPVARLPRQPAPAAVAAAAQERRGQGPPDRGRHHPDRGGAQPRGHGHHARGPRDAS